MSPVDILIELLSTHNVWETSRILERGEFLKYPGKTDTRLYFIESGSMRIYVMDAEEEHTIRLGYSGNIIAALDSFITDQPSDLSLQALKKTKLKVVSKKRFMAFVQEDAERLQLWLSLLSGFVHQQMERERDILIASPAERYRRVWERSPRLFQEIPAKYIASYLRMSPETLSRLKKS